MKEYWLIKDIKTTGHKNPLQIVDKVTARTIREAEKEFKRRNNFQKLTRKADLIIAKSERWIIWTTRK